MTDPLAKLRADSNAWSDEYLTEQYDLGHAAFVTEAAWEIVRAEFTHRGLLVDQPEETGESQETGAANEAPHDHTSYAVNRVSEGAAHVDVISGLIERGLVEGEANQLVRGLAEARQDAARQSARQGLAWCAGGVVITIATFLTAAPGETFIVAWGAIAFGAIQAWQGRDVAQLPLPVPDDATHAASMSSDAPSAGRQHGQSQESSSVTRSASTAPLASGMETSRRGMSVGTKLFLLAVSLYVVLRIAWVIMTEGV